MKQFFILSALVAAATPANTEVSSVDHYQKYTMQLDHAHASIAMTKSAIEEAREMNEKMIERTAEKMDSIKQEVNEAKEKAELMMVVLETNNIEIPKSREEWFEDSIRMENMLKINKK
jgi:uncharacterized HAD superfamily protein